MANLLVDPKKIRQNIQLLQQYFESHRLSWSLITKMLSANKDLLAEVLTPEVCKGIHSIGDSRISGLQAVKEIDPKIQTLYIKPPAQELADEIVAFADISMNTSWDTIQALDRAAGKAGVLHHVLVMIELGELREGILGEKLLDFYRRIFSLEHVKVIGIGTNLGCLFGVEPTRDKLIQMSLYKQLLEASFSKKVELVSGGTSITLPLIEDRKLPRGVNHFRIGEAVFMGTSPLTGEQLLTLHTDSFKFEAQIMKIEAKEGTPDGVIGEGSIGHGPESAQIFDLEPGETSVRALVDYGLIDADPQDLQCTSEDVRFFGSTSDMTVYDLGKNRTPKGEPRYQVGQALSFRPSYMGVARLLSSKFVNILTKSD